MEHVQSSLGNNDETAKKLSRRPTRKAFVFSYSPSGDKPMHQVGEVRAEDVDRRHPSTVTHRYDRLVERLGIHTTLHKLRHYNATELIAAGVDIRTVAGRLGHAGGGTTTLRVYAAWVSEADKRAARAVCGQLPGRPASKQ